MVLFCALTLFAHEFFEALFKLVLLNGRIAKGSHANCRASTIIPIVKVTKRWIIQIVAELTKSPRELILSKCASAEPAWIIKHHTILLSLADS